ncbi:unnamed protein product [Lampetra fluviatilis]
MLNQCLDRGLGEPRGGTGSRDEAQGAKGSSEETRCDTMRRRTLQKATASQVGENDENQAAMRSQGVGIIRCSVSDRHRAPIATDERDEADTAQSGSAQVIAAGSGGDTTLGALR